MLFNPQRQLTFSRFGIRPGNRRARAACGQFAIQSSIPCGGPLLVIAGRPGSGKTHLLHATSNLAARRDFIGDRITVGGSRLADEVQKADQYGDLMQWFDRFTNIDWLAIDDVDRMQNCPVASNFLLKLLQARLAAKRRTLLSLTLGHAASSSSPFTAFLNPQTAVWLT
jgi:chromosomal replication initiation ATPase DnaA